MDYINSVMDRVRKELKLDCIGYSFDLKVKEYGEKMTLDGINYFRDIEVVEILNHNEVIGSYNVKGKKLSVRNNIGNVVIANEVVKFMNNYLGKEVYELSKSMKSKLISIENKKDEIFESEGECGLSDYEISLMI